jgi:hypothetical protein
MTAPYISPPPQLLATKVRKARHESICPACHSVIGVGVRKGYVQGRGWLHVTPCIVGGKRPMIGPSNEPQDHR